jgi:choline dehydrogenase
VTDSFDVIVVGSGSGGAVVARRLVDAGASVCVIEAGGIDENPAIHDPGRLWELWEADVDALQWSLDQVREISRAGALAEWLGEELYPGPGVSSSEDIRNYLRETAITYHHQVGTCRMGVDELAVVDPQLLVRGVEGLRVADASVMPTVTGGNTHAPTTMIGERAADLVLGVG